MKNITTDQLIAIIGEKEADKFFLNKEWLYRQNEVCEGILSEFGIFDNYMDIVPSNNRYSGMFLFYVCSDAFDNPGKLKINLSGLEFPIIDFSSVGSEEIEYLDLSDSYCEIKLDSFKLIKIESLNLENSILENIEDLQNDLELLKLTYLPRLKTFKNQHDLKIKKLTLNNSTLLALKLKEINEFNGTIENLIYRDRSASTQNLFENMKEMFKNVNVKNFVEE